MNRKGIIVLGFAIVLILMIGSFAKVSTSKQPTRTSREGMEYGGQNCIMYNEKLYWQQAPYEEIIPDTMQLVGTVTKAVDALPTKDFESAVTAVGSEIYFSENMPGRIIVKEDDSYSTYWLQENGQ